MGERPKSAHPATGFVFFFLRKKACLGKAWLLKKKMREGAVQTGSK
jgi:hypothetical protein